MPDVSCETALLQLLAERFDIEATTSTRLDEMPLDSLDFIQMSNEIEDRFGVVVPRGLKWETVSDIVRWIECPA